MQRRDFLSGAAVAMLARPAIGGAAKTLIFVPQSPLASLDPVWTSAMTTRNVGFMIYDVLFGRDAAMNPKPQMLAGYVVEDDGKPLGDDAAREPVVPRWRPRCWRATAPLRCGAG